jgi:squalene-hopene/tetraprenyl-beta-curcumene cyclase
MRGTDAQLGLAMSTAEKDVGEGLVARAAEAIRRASEWLFAAQHPRGYWQAPLEANPTMEAELVFFNRLLGRDKPDLDRRMADRLLVLQQPDGSWPGWYGGPGELSITIEAYFALKLAGHHADEAPLERAREFILARGGLARAGVFTRIWLAYFGQFPWDRIPAMPVELNLLPSWFPLNIYAMSSWARGTVVPLTLLLAHPPAVKVSDDERLTELWSGAVAPDPLFTRSTELVTWRNVFLALDAVVKRVGRSPWKPLRRRAIARAIDWVLRHQDTNGQWGGIQPAMLNSVLALHAVGFAKDHPVIARGIQGVDDFLVQCDDTLVYQPCVSPNWDTGLAARALLDAGVDPAHPSLAKAGEWLVANQIFRPGDFNVYEPTLEPGGWAFEFANDWYPDVDDSAVILMVLQDLPLARTAAGKRAIAAGLNWTLGMQSRDGGWGAFDVDNSSDFLNRIPFADMEAMIDPPTEDLTGRLLHCMGTFGFGMDYGRVRRAVEFLRRTQRPDGSWWGRWGVNFVYGTWCALVGLAAIGEDMQAPYVRRAAEWLRTHQNADGGWGETIASYDDESLAGTGASTASQTAWALMGLLAAGEARSAAVERGVAFLLSTQTDDGTWEERAWTGTGFPRHFYLRYHMYRHYFPLMALGQFRSRMGGGAG